MGGTVIGFIGLGMMGAPMARNLLAAGHTIRGQDLDARAAEAFADAPAFSFHSTAAAASTGADVVILMLPDSRVVDALLWSDAAGLAKALAPGQILIDMGSSDPVRTRDNAARLKAMGVHMLDAPVSGGVKRARDGSLSVMIGGDAAVVEQTRPVLQAMGRNLVHLGSNGAGHAVKALNNYVSASGLVAVCEALVAAQAFGIDPHLVNQVFNTSTGKNNTTDVKVESFMLSEAFNSGFALSLMRKDLQTALDFIERMGTPDGFARQCLQTWQAAEAGLGPGADHTEMFRFIRQAT